MAQLDDADAQRGKGGGRGEACVGAVGGERRAVLGAEIEGPGLRVGGGGVVGEERATGEDGEMVRDEAEEDGGWEGEDVVGGVEEGVEVLECSGGGEVGFGGGEDEGGWEGWVRGS